MSDTLEKLQAMLVKQLGIPAAEIDPDCSLQDIGLDVADLEELKLLFEQSYSIEMSLIVKDHYNIDIEMPEKHLKDQSLRQLAGWVDGWDNCGAAHRHHNGRHKA